MPGRELRLRHDPSREVPRLPQPRLPSAPSPPKLLHSLLFTSTTCVLTTVVDIGVQQQTIFCFQMANDCVMDEGSNDLVHIPSHVRMYSDLSADKFSGRQNDDTSTEAAHPLHTFFGPVVWRCVLVLWSKSSDFYCYLFHFYYHLFHLLAF